MIDNIFQFWVFSILVLPGLVALLTFNSASLRKSVRVSENLYSIAILSFLNISVAFLISLLFLDGNSTFSYVKGAVSGDFEKLFSWYFYVLLVYYLIFQPICIGVFLSIVSKIGAFGAVSAFFGLGHLNVIPTAFEHKFSKMEPEFIIVTLNNGGKVYGWFGTNSMASSDDKNQDLYIERLYEIKDNKWVEPNNDERIGMWIAAPQIQHIQFVKIG